MEKKVASAGLVLGLFLIANLGVFAQKIRVLEKARPLPNAPIEIVGHSVGDTPFTDQMRVLAGMDWLEHLNLEIKNVSEKNIISVDLTVRIEKRGNMPRETSLPILFRAFSELDTTKTQEGAMKRGVLIPGEVINLKINRKDVEWLYGYLKKHNVEELDRVKLYIESAYFDDKTHWIFGKEGTHEMFRAPELSQNEISLSQRLSSLPIIDSGKILTAYSLWEQIQVQGESP